MRTDGYAAVEANLQDTSISDGGRAVSGERLHATAGGATCLDGPDSTFSLEIISLDLTKDDVLSIEPASDDGGDEKLRAVAGMMSAAQYTRWQWIAIRTCLGQHLPWTACTACRG